jgi:uncharacterized membrane protein YgcG
MQINLAKVVPWLGLLVVGFFWVVAQGASGQTGVDDSYDWTYADTSRADAYLDRVATELAQPGVYVDPAVTSISAADAARLSDLAADTPGPVRVLVVPADALREHDPSQPPEEYYYETNELAYPDADLPAQLYDRVGVDGTYAVLVDAASSYDGRSFSATQFSEERPFYRVEEAVDHAVDCCAPDYEAMLTAFLERAGDEQTNPWPILGWVVGGLGAAVGLFLGGRRLVRRRREKADDARVADALRPSLQEEVIELETSVGALPPASASDPPEIATRTRTVLDLVEEARQRLDATGGEKRVDTPSEVEQVVLRLSDARYELTAIDALRHGRPVPEKTAPCFFDPRHGPSVAEAAYTPEGGAERDVPVCAACRDRLAAGEVPPTRSIRIGDVVKPYWEWDRYSRPYVNGYWRNRTFPDATFQRQRFGSAAPVSRAVSKPLFQFVWESDDNGGSGGWGGGGGGGGRRFSGSSGRRRSFGGGSSRRSSSRSSRSRRF